MRRSINREERIDMKILVALDYSDNAEALLSQALQFATAMQASVTLLHVFSFISELESDHEDRVSMAGIETANVSQSEFETWRLLAQKSEKTLSDYLHPFRQKNIAVQALHIMGQPGPVICARAEQLDADIIMMGRRSQCSQTERALGSVSNFVIHHAPCSVWVIQANPE